METGTGKTYVYLRTIFELNKLLRLHQVRDRRALGRDQGGRLQDAPDHRGAFQGPLFRPALRLFPLRFRQARAGAKFRDQPEHPDHGGDRRRHQQEGRQQPLQGQREDRRRAADRPDPRDAADPDRRRAAERGWRPVRRGQEGAGRDEPALHAPLFGDPCRQASHGVPPGRGGRL